MNEEQKIVAIYTRVSTIDQAREGYSLEEQEKRLKAMCEANNYKIYNVYTDAGISGKSITNRPAYQQMIKDMKHKKFNMIIAFKMDRISRSIVDFENFFNELKENNCGIQLLCENIDTSGAAGMMFARILGIFAQFERELIKERTLVGVESAVSKGHFGGKPPLGYKHALDKSGKQKLKEWVIDEDEAKIVKEIYNLCASGKTYFQISTILKEKYPNVISSYRIDKETNKKIPIYRSWTDSSISCILNNKSYMGIYEHRKRLKDKETIQINGIIPPIVDDKLFYDCQDSIMKNSRNYYRSKDYLFMQKLKCPKCGRILACNGTRKPNETEYLYYKCKDCGVYIREELIEKALINELNSLFELCNAINNNHAIVDSKIADDFNNSKIDHKIRFAIDKRIISDKLTLLDSIGIKNLWEIASREAKCEFIRTYVDEISVKSFKNNRNKITDIKLIDLKLKPHKIKELLDYKNKNMIDKVLGKGINQMSVMEVKHDRDALDYINILKKQFNVMVINFDNSYNENDNNNYLDPRLFKIIKVRPTRCVEKPKTYSLILAENPTM